MNWTNDVENILKSVRVNAVHMSRTHKRNYFVLKQMSNWFRVPTIVLSAVASIVSVGFQAYIAQQHISAITCLLSMCIGLMNSIELYLKLVERIEQELEDSKKWYQLSADIFTLLALDKCNRDGQPKEILQKFYIRYIELFHESSLTKINNRDKLLSLSIEDMSSELGSNNDAASSSSSLNSGDVSPLVRRDQVLEEQL